MIIPDKTLYWNNIAPSDIRYILIGLIMAILFHHS